MKVAKGTLYLKAILANCIAMRAARNERYIMSSRGHPPAEITSHGTRCHDRNPQLAPPWPRYSFRQNTSTSEGPKSLSCAGRIRAKRAKKVFGISAKCAHSIRSLPPLAAQGHVCDSHRARPSRGAGWRYDPRCWRDLPPHSGRSGPEAAMRACSVLAANHAIEARADCRQDGIWLGKQTAPLAQTPVRCRCAGSSRALLRFRTGVVPKASTSPPMGWSGRAPASTARKAGTGATTTRSAPSPTGSLRNRRARRVASAGGNSQVQGMDRSDPYQERAREMACEAGLDPDGRIERPGQRSMPIWCTFRDAARKEHLAREAADAANTIAAEKPQAPQ